MCLEGGGNNWAANTRTMEVLESVRRRIDARKLRRGRIIRGEAELDSWVVDSLASCNVLVQLLCSMSQSVRKGV